CKRFVQERKDRTLTSIEFAPLPPCSRDRPQRLRDTELRGAPCDELEQLLQQSARVPISRTGRSPSHPRGSRRRVPPLREASSGPSHRRKAALVRPEDAPIGHSRGGTLSPRS